MSPLFSSQGNETAAALGALEFDLRRKGHLDESLYVEAIGKAYFTFREFDKAGIEVPESTMQFMGKLTNELLERHPRSGEDFKDLMWMPRPYKQDDLTEAPLKAIQGLPVESVAPFEVVKSIVYPIADVAEQVVAKAKGLEEGNKKLEFSGANANKPLNAERLAGRHNADRYRTGAAIKVIQKSPDLLKGFSEKLGEFDMSVKIKGEIKRNLDNERQEYSRDLKAYGENPEKFTKEWGEGAVTRRVRNVHHLRDRLSRIGNPLEERPAWLAARHPPESPRGESPRAPTPAAHPGGPPTPGRPDSPTRNQPR